MNKVELIGTITADIEVKYTKDNSKEFINFTVAVNRRFVEQTDFIRCVAWNKTADFISKYFNKGSKIGIVGNIQVRNYEDKDGNKRSITEIVVEEVYFVGNAKKQVEETSAANEGENQEVMWEDDLPF